MARIDAPLLSFMDLKLIYHPVLDIPQVPRFILRSEIVKPPIKVDVYFYDHAAYITFVRRRGGYFFLQFSCTGLDRQLSLLKHIFTQCLPLLSHACPLNLSISNHHDSQLDQQDSISLMGFLRLFNAVQILHVSGSSPRYSLNIHIARVLGELTGESVARVLPMLHTLKLDGFDRVEHLVTPLLKHFIDARQVLGHPVVIR
jgi:hypothetical protein